MVPADPSQIARTPSIGKVARVESVLIEVVIGASFVSGFCGTSALSLFGGALFPNDDRRKGLELVLSGRAYCCDAELSTTSPFDMGACLEWGVDS